MTRGQRQAGRQSASWERLNFRSWRKFALDFPPDQSVGVTCARPAGLASVGPHAATQKLGAPHASKESLKRSADC